MFSFACYKQNHANADISSVHDKLMELGKLHALTRVQERDLKKEYAEVALFELNDPSYEKAIETKLRLHLDKVKAASSIYNPSEKPKLEPVKANIAGKFVYFAIGEGYNTLINIEKEYIK